MNKKGFTLTEMLLAALIVGIIGVALAALTTAAVRESGRGRTKVMLRNQLALAIRQLRQDIYESTKITIGSGGDSISLNKGVAVGPNQTTSGDVVRYYGDPTEHSMKRTVNGTDSEVWLPHVKDNSGDGFDFVSPSFTLLDNDTYSPHVLLRVRMIVEVGSNPKVNDVIEEIFVLPQGIIVEE